MLHQPAKSPSARAHCPAASSLLKKTGMRFKIWKCRESVITGRRAGACGRRPVLFLKASSVRESTCDFDEAANQLGIVLVSTEWHRPCWLARSGPQGDMPLTEKLLPQKEGEPATSRLSGGALARTTEQVTWGSPSCGWLKVWAASTGLKSGPGRDTGRGQGSWAASNRKQAGLGRGSQARANQTIRRCPKRVSAAWGKYTIFYSLTHSLNRYWQSSPCRPDTILVARETKNFP